MDKEAWVKNVYEMAEEDPDLKKHLERNPVDVEEPLSIMLVLHMMTATGLEKVEKSVSALAKLVKLLEVKIAKLEEKND